MKAKTMVYLEPEQLQALRRRAATQGVSIAELVRRAVNRFLESGDVAPKVPRQTYLKIVGLGSSGRTDISEEHDRHIAEALKREHTH